MRGVVGLVSCLVFAACEREPVYVPRVLTAPYVIVDFRGVQTVRVEHMRATANVPPVKRAEVRAWLLDRANVRVDSVAVRVDAPSDAVGASVSVEVDFVPPSKAPLRLVVDWGEAVGSTELRVYVVERLSHDADFEVTYVDSMDSCVAGLFRLPSGRVACGRGDGRVSLYDAQGKLETSFEGFDVVVRGDELWSSTDGGLEHRSDVSDGGLRFDGRVDFALTTPIGETTRGMALRGFDDKVVQALWDGTTLTHRVLDGYPDLSSGVGVLIDGEVVSVVTDASQVCRIEASCQQSTCTPGLRCLSDVSGPIVTPDAFFELAFDIDDARVVVRDRARPEQGRDILLPSVSSAAASSLMRTSWRQLSMTMRPVVVTPDGTFFPVASDDEVWLRMWNHSSEVVWVSDETIIALVNPYTLHFHRLD